MAADARLADKIVVRLIASLHPYLNNPRTHTPEQVRQLSRSIREFGFTNPVLIDAEGGIIAGHGRVLAAKELGFTEVPTIELGYLTEDQRRAYIIADNQLALNAGWDEDMLKGELAALQDQGFNLRLLGIDSNELDRLLHLNTLDPDETPLPPEQPVTRPGDLWLLGHHRILCGDSLRLTDVTRLLDGAAPHLIVTSPPYNQNIEKFSDMQYSPYWIDKVARLAYNDNLSEADYQNQQRDLLSLWHSILRDGGSLFYNHKNRYRQKHMITPLAWLPGPFNFRQEIVWNRGGSVTQNMRGFLPCDERIYWLYKGDTFTFNAQIDEIKAMTTVWSISPHAGPDHPTAFPVEIPTRCIRACSQQGELVLDPFLGSGTTLIAAETLQRVCYGLDLSPAFVDVAVVRWQNFTGQSACLAGTGEAFESLLSIRTRADAGATDANSLHDN